MALYPVDGMGDENPPDAAAVDQPEEEDRSRLSAYAYLTAPERDDYLAVMRLFTGSLLADLAAPDVAARLPQVGPDVVVARLDQLVEWGNLLRSTHRVKAHSISEFQRARSRYQVSKLGERVQRGVDDVLGHADAAREVAAEMLGMVDRGLAELADAVELPGGVGAMDPEHARDTIATVFVQFGEFAESVRDFYAYLGDVLSRYDLDGAEYRGFKELLLDYVEAIREDVSYHAPRIEDSLRILAPHLPRLLRRIDEASPGLSGLESVGGARVQRTQGRDLADWEALRGWFTAAGDASADGSQVEQLRDATLRALSSLLMNAKRMIRSSHSGQSRRGYLLRLARWFDRADEATAHDLFAAAFGLYPARHLAYPGDLDRPEPATTSWWTGPVVDVPVALRERGERIARGRAAAVEDHAAQKEKLLSEAAERARLRAAAAAELRSAAGRLEDIRLSGAAHSLLLELLATALGNAQAGALDGAEARVPHLGIGLRVRPVPGYVLRLATAEGHFELEGLALDIVGADADELASANRLTGTGD
ncbi:TIGR02677 family protein [Yinghuangia seranimata]|uniref:TIGR02677 family protein n=1 Tax=Yinghuangia seranimata TaxID=408067 RepID=UPI00248AFD42|nr:TIGR02677 family protein [Yinghuangia seranimata]MDI2125099.1 TIGR02677 family protein [Yinghuangia seranimata]